MKRFLLHIISFVLAAYFLIAGSGFNLIDYCCNGCRNAGIEYVVTHSCFDVHSHEGDACCSTQHQNDEHSVSITHSHADHCSVNRFNVETPTVSAFSHFHPGDFFKLVIAMVEVNDLMIETTVTENFHLKFPPPLLTSTGRNILSLKSVLII